VRLSGGGSHRYGFTCGQKAFLGHPEIRGASGCSLEAPARPIALLRATILSRGA
jgi:hypothetical protein